MQHDVVERAAEPSAELARDRRRWAGRHLLQHRALDVDAGPPRHTVWPAPRQQLVEHDA